MPYYKDLREHIKALEVNNKLARIKREINKDTELMPLVRWQFRGLSEAATGIEMDGNGLMKVGERICSVESFQCS